MAENFEKKKRIRARHRASATRILTKGNEALVAGTADEANLLQLKLTLEEKLGTLKQLDSEIHVVELTEEDDLATEIEQADDYKAEIYYVALVKIDKALKLTMPPVPATAAPTVAASLA